MNPQNGVQAVTVPDDIVWDAENPPILYGCSQYIEHNPQCDRSCQEVVSTESQIELINEAYAWRRAGMSYFGIPAIYENAIPIVGIKVELFDLEIKFMMVREILMENMGMSEDDIEERFRKTKTNLMRTIREANEPDIRRRRMEEMLSVARQPLLGPDGRPL